MLFQLFFTLYIFFYKKAQLQKLTTITIQHNKRLDNEPQQMKLTLE